MKLTPSRPSGGSSRASTRSIGGGTAMALAAASTIIPPQACSQRWATPPGSAGISGSAAPPRIRVPNTPWTSRRGPPSTSGRVVLIAAWGGVPSASACTSATRSANRALASSGSGLRVALSISASRSGRRRSASAAMAWAKARSSGRSRSRVAVSSAASSGSPLRNTASSSRNAARRAGSPTGSDSCLLIASSSCLRARRRRNVRHCPQLQFGSERHGQAPAPRESAPASVQEPARAGARSHGRGRRTWRPQGA